MEDIYGSNRSARSHTNTGWTNSTGQTHLVHFETELWPRAAMSKCHWRAARTSDHPNVKNLKLMFFLIWYLFFYLYQLYGWITTSKY